MRTPVACGVLVAGLLAAAVAAPQGPTGRQVMEELERRHRVRYETAEIRLLVRTSAGDERERRVLFYIRSQDDGLDQMLVRFREPAELRGMGLLTHEVAGADDDQWLYIPAIKKVKRIASGSKSGRFAGTDFSFGDLRPEDLDAHDYTLEGSEDVGGVECLRVVAVGRGEERVHSGYDRRVIYVRPDLYVVPRVDLYDLEGRHEKRMTRSDFHDAGGVQRARVVVMQDLPRGQETVLIYESRDLTTELTDRLFSQRELEAGGE
ncbi:MAG: outer membrane lipoprotein-sorting protein [Planctomycetes bacterium]|nr:outer membrane lipoprotein-sorting protein [Planctomycetota bacterium]